MNTSSQKALLKRQQKIAANQKAWEQSQAQALADHEASKPKDWKTAYKNAGGNHTAVWSTVGSTLGGGVLGGGIDASMGNDSWTDGATVGAGLGAIAGVGGFARSVHNLKVGRMTKSVEPAGGLSSTPLNEQQKLAQRNMRDSISARRTSL